ncbi:MAG: hypothetical protein HY822_17875 [Acidobacteria bacterium]|nr:hypothetical protein [Acidobacteriota bacterium]
MLTALVGFLFTWLQNQRENREANTRIYADLLSKREEADSALRKDMFSTVMTKFLAPATEDVDQQILQVELLAYNFHEALDIAPLFKHIHRRIALRGEGTPEQLERLEKAASDVTAKETGMLGEAGVVEVLHIDLAKLQEHPEGVLALRKNLWLKSDSDGRGDPLTDPRVQANLRRFTVEVLEFDRRKREFQFRLRVSPPGKPEAEEEVDSWFWAGFFDFPMIDNTRLSKGQRCAIVLNTLVEKQFAKATLAYFPGSRASLKDKPYYDEVIQDLLRTRRRAGELNQP